MKETDMIEVLREKGYTVKPNPAFCIPTKGYVIDEGGKGNYHMRRNRLSKKAFDWPEGTKIAEVDFTKLKWEPI